MSIRAIWACALLSSCGIPDSSIVQSPENQESFRNQGSVPTPAPGIGGLRLFCAGRCRNQFLLLTPNCPACPPAEFGLGAVSSGSGSRKRSEHAERANPVSAGHCNTCIPRAALSGNDWRGKSCYNQSKNQSDILSSFWQASAGFPAPARAAFLRTLEPHAFLLTAPQTSASWFRAHILNTWVCSKPPYRLRRQFQNGAFLQCTPALAC